MPKVNFLLTVSIDSALVCKQADPAPEIQNEWVTAAWLHKVG